LYSLVKLEDSIQKNTILNCSKNTKWILTEIYRDIDDSCKVFIPIWLDVARSATVIDDHNALKEMSK